MCDEAAMAGAFSEPFMPQKYFEDSILEQELLQVFSLKRLPCEETNCCATYQGSFRCVLAGLTQSHVASFFGPSVRSRSSKHRRSFEIQDVSDRG